MTYQISASAVAAAPQKTEALKTVVATLGRRLYLATPNKTDSDVNFLNDLMRGRYALVTVERITDLAARAKRPEIGEALADVIRYRSLPPMHTSPNVTVSFDGETRSNGDFDMAQRLFERHPTRANLERLEEEGLRQIASTRESIDAARRQVVL